MKNKKIQQILRIVVIKLCIIIVVDSVCIIFKTKYYIKKNNLMHRSFCACLENKKRGTLLIVSCFQNKFKKISNGI